MRLRFCALIASSFTILASATLAQGAPDAWAVRKCELYAAAWADALRMRGREGLGEAFLANHDAFLASGCTRVHDVCPRSPAEIEMANVLTIMSMAEGMASTFVPFQCRKG